jgi:hypothetical protein
LALNRACWAQELSVEDRACITKAAAKLPKVATIGQSRVVPQPQAQGLHEQDVYHVKEEIDVMWPDKLQPISLTASTAVPLTVIQPLGMR